MQRTDAGQGSEYPHGDRIQLLMLPLFWLVWTADFASYFIFHYSTVLFELTPFPATLAIAVVPLAFGLNLIAKSHRCVLEGKYDKPTLVDTGVYSWVRHPMYLGTLMILLGFFFVNLSVLSFIIWIAFFVLYDKMATYEEKDLVRILGEEYVAYQKRVRKWQEWSESLNAFLMFYVRFRHTSFQCDGTVWRVPKRIMFGRCFRYSRSFCCNV